MPIAKKHSAEPKQATKPILRDLELGDCARILELYYNFDKVHYNLRPDYYQKPQKPARSHQFFLEAIFHPNKKFLVAEKGGKIVGFLHMTILDAFHRDLIEPRKTLSVHEIIVDTPNKNRRVSTLFGQFIVTFATENGCHDVVADVDYDNTLSIEYQKKFKMVPVNIRMQGIIDANRGQTPAPPSLSWRIYKKLARLKIALYSIFWRPKSADKT